MSQQLYENKIQIIKEEIFETTKNIYSFCKSRKNLFIDIFEYNERINYVCDEGVFFLQNIHLEFNTIIDNQYRIYSNHFLKKLKLKRDNFLKKTNLQGKMNCGYDKTRSFCDTYLNLERKCHEELKKQNDQFVEYLDYYMNFLEYTRNSSLIKIDF